MKEHFNCECGQKLFERESEGECYWEHGEEERCAGCGTSHAIEVDDDGICAMVEV